MVLVDPVQPTVVHTGKRNQREHEKQLEGEPVNDPGENGGSDSANDSFVPLHVGHGRFRMDKNEHKSKNKPTQKNEARNVFHFHPNFYDV